MSLFLSNHLKGHKTMKRMRRLAVTFVTAMILVMAGQRSAEAASTLWTYKSPSEVKWHQLTDISTLLVGTDEGLTLLDPDQGSVVWQRSDLKKVAKYQVEEVVGTPLLLASVNEGGFSNKTKLVALDIATGQTIWETDKLKGATVGFLPVYQKNMVIVLTSKGAAASKDKPDMLALDMTTGETRWEAEFADKVDLHQSDTSGKFFQKFDLSGHEDPVYDGDLVFFTYAGLHCYDLNTGKLVWGVPYDVTEKTYKKANAQAIVDDDVVYTSSKGVLRAHDKSTGAVKWATKDFGGGIAQMLANGSLLYGRMGGQFYEYKEREWKLAKPLGIVAVDKSSGNLLWRYDKAKDGITNMALLRDQNVVMIADSKSMIGLDASGNEAFRVELEFKHKIGAGAKAAKGAMKFAKGGLMGFAKKDKSDLDLPVAIDLRENGTAVVRGAQHALAFNPQAKQIAWSVQFPAPGVSGWKLAVMAGLSAMQYGYHYNRAANSYLGTYQNTWANNQKAQVVANYEKLFNKRFTASKAATGYTYVLTNVEEGDDDGAGLVGLNMNSGQVEHQVLLKMKEPDYEVDELTGRIFNVKDKKEITAYSVR
jgi:outer membrane protein assembly factor BamB